MQDFDFYFNIIQGLVFFLIFLFSILIARTIYRKDPSFIINKSFSLGLIILGSTYLFSFAGNLIVFIQNEGNVFFIRTAYFLAPIAFMFFYNSALGIYKGIENMYSKPKIVFFSIIFTLNFVLIYVFNGVYLNPNNSLDSKTTTEFKIIVLGLIFILYLFIFYFFWKSYGQVDQDTKKNISWFLKGWLIGGIGLSSVVASDFFRLLDLFGPIIVCFGMYIISKGFTSQAPQKSNA